MGFFRRVEEKYFLTKSQYEEINKYIEKYFEKDKYYYSTIYNIYFDTENDDLVIKSNEKPEYKEKVRLRSYNMPSLNDKVFLEIKKKYNKIVSKRRVELKLKDFYDYYNNKKFENSQIFKEIDYAFNYYDLKPKVFISYERLAYHSIDNIDFRLTFDYNIKYRKNDLFIESDKENKNLYDYEYYVMEVKTLDSLPLWFTSILSNMKIYPCSFSKYGNVYRKKEEYV